MKTNVRGWVGLVVCVALLLAWGVVSGCASSRKVDALMAATQEQAKRAATTEAVMIELAKRGSTVIPDTIATVEPGSMVGWAQSTRVARDEVNKPLMNKDGSPVMETTTAIGKTRSDRVFGALKSGVIKLAALPFDIKSGEVKLSGILEGGVVYVESERGDSGLSAEHAKVYTDAIVAEKVGIIESMGKLERERGAAYAVKVEALLGGMATVTTAVGTQAVQILKCNPVIVGAEQAALGISKIVQAVGRTDDDKLVQFLAADTPTVKNATALLTAESTPPAK